MVHRPGEAAGRAAGIDEGRKLQAVDAATQRRDERNWTSCREAITAAGNRAEQLAKRDNPATEEQFLAAVSTVVQDAGILRAGYQSKASAFDSTMEQLSEALKERNFEQARMLVMTLRETLPVKENSFFAPDKLHLDRYRFFQGRPIFNLPGVADHG